MKIYQRNLKKLLSVLSVLSLISCAASYEIVGKKKDNRETPTTFGQPQTPNPNKNLPPSARLEILQDGVAKTTVGFSLKK